MRWFLFTALLWLATITGVAAQIPLPQTVTGPEVPSGLDASGNFTNRLVNFTDLNFGTIYGAQTTSTSQNTAQWGSAVYVLDSNPGYQVNNTLQGQCLDDGISFVIGFITALDSSSGSTVLTLDVTIAQGGSPCSNWFFQVINGPTNGVPPSQALAISTTSFALPVAGKEQTLTVDANKGYTAGSLIFIAALGDSSTWCWAVVENYNTSTGVMVTFVVQSSGTGLTYTNWTVGMNGTLAPFVPILGFSGTSLTFATTGGAAVMTVSLAGSVVGGAGAGIAAGSVISMTTQTGLLLNNSHIVVSDSADSTKYFRGIGQYNSVTGAIKIYVTDVHAGTGGTISTWSLFAQDGPPVNANQIAVSQTSNTIGAGDFTFTIQAGQNLPIQGPVTLTALASPLNQMLATIKAYSGTSLIVTVLSSGVYGSGTFAAWSILNTGPAQTRISLYQMNGLQITNSGATLTINAGSVRDSTDTIDLSLGATTTLDLTSTAKIVQVSQTGTISSAANAVTGVGTTFSANFGNGSANNSFTDWTNQAANLNLNVGTTFAALIATAAATSKVTARASDTALTTDVALGAGAGTAFFRGGPIYTANTQNIDYGIVIARKDSDGSIGVFASSATISGTPDLPSGYTYYRVIGVVDIHYNGSSYTVNIAQVLNSLNLSNPISGILPVVNGGTGKTMSGITEGQGITYSASNGFFAPSLAIPKAIYSATITPTALGINESSCNTTTGVVTFASDFSASLTASGQSIVLTGTVSTGYTTGRALYVNIASNTTLTTWNLYSDAVAGSGSSQVKCTVNNNAGWSLRWFAYTNVFNVGFSTIAPIGGTPGQTQMAFDYNLTNALATTAGAVQFLGFSLIDSGAAQRKTWTPSGTAASTATPPFTFTSTTLVQQNDAVSDGDTLLGTWAQQSTTAFQIEVWIHGALDEPIPANDNDLQLREVA